MKSNRDVIYRTIGWMIWVFWFSVFTMMDSGAGAAAVQPRAEVSPDLRKRSEAVLRHVMDKQQRWVKVHAAEALLWHGRPEGVEEMFIQELKSADPQYKIGCLRVLARHAAAPAKRQKIIRQIRAIAIRAEDKTIRITAVETLAKLGYTRTEDDRKLTRFAQQQTGTLAPFARWITANTGERQDIRSLAVLLKSDDRDTRGLTGYPLRHLKKLPPDVVWSLKSAVNKEPADSAKRIYLLSAWYAHAQGEDRAAARELLLQYLESGGKDEKYEACSALGQAGDAADLALLTRLLGDPEADVQSSAAHAILRIGRRVPRTMDRRDWLVVVIYGLGMAGVGWYYSRRTATTEDYLLGGRRMNSIAVGLSLFASLLSTISYLAWPGEIIKHGPIMLCGLAAYPLIVLVVGWFIIPFIMRLRVTSAYEILESRLGLSVRMLGSFFFLSLRLIWMAVIIYATTSKVLIPMLGWPDWATPYACAVLGLLTVLYTTMGGLRAVVFTDVVQTLILFGGAVLTLVIITSSLGGVGSWWPRQWAPNWQDPVLLYGPNASRTFFGAMLAAFTWHVCTSGSDQMAIQRYLATRDVKAARRVLFTSMSTDILVVLFLVPLGLALLAYFRVHPYLAPDGPTIVDQADRLFPRFIAFGLPVGIGGLVVAGLLAAAMSSLSSGLNSSCSVITVDFVDRFCTTKMTETGHVKLAKYISVAIGVVVVLLSSLVGQVPGNLLEIANKTVNLLVAPLFGLFFMAMFVRWATTFGTLAGAACGLATVVLINYWEPITGASGVSFLWAMPLGLVVQVASGMIFSLLPIGPRRGSGNRK